MFHIGIDISKSKHDCFIATDAGVKVKSFTFKNDLEGFLSLKENLEILGDPNLIKIGFESTGHYGVNLKSYLSKLGYTFIEFNPQLTSKFSQATSLRRAKTDKIDSKIISSMLGHFDYKSLHTKFYHINELKELVRQRDRYQSSRSKELVKLTNLLDKAFPEFKPFFGKSFTKTSLYIIKIYKTKERISKLPISHHDKLRRMSRGSITYAKFIKLKSLAKESIGVSSPTYDYLIPIVIDMYYHLSKLIEELDNKITILYNQTNSLIHTIPGMGIITAASIYAEIGDIHNFSNPGKLIAYAGLDVKISQSGQKESKGSIVKHGSPLLRLKLHQTALSTLKTVPQFYNYFHKKKSLGKHRNVIFTHISRKLLRIIHHMEYNKIPFDINKVR